MDEGQISYYRSLTDECAATTSANPLTCLWTRGSTPLLWGGAGTSRFALTGMVTPRDFTAAFARGGFRHPETGCPLVRARRRGFTIFITPDKSISVLGVIGRWDEALTVVEAETAATMGYLDDWAQRTGGRRGKRQLMSPTSGLVYATSRHVTSAAGDPFVHDHVIVANVAEMLDAAAGYKALHSGGLRDKLEAASMVGRMAAAAKAVELGYAIEPDPGPSGRRRSWRLAGVPSPVCRQFSKRAADIEAHLAATPYTSRKAREVAAHITLPAGERQGVAALLDDWHRQLDAIGWPTDLLTDHVDQSRHRPYDVARPLTARQVEDLSAVLLRADGVLLGTHGYFTESRLIAELVPHLYGHALEELNRVVRMLVRSPLIRAQAPATSAREPGYSAADPAP